MTASVMAPPADSSVGRIVVFANGALKAFGTPQFKVFTRKNAAGTDETVHLYEGVPVFRSGTFMDSMGEEHEWLPGQIDQMAANFTYLKDSGVFADVPVRRGHPHLFGDDMSGLIGYITNVRAETRKSPLRDDSNEYHYLLADYEILDPEAQQKIPGLWRNRSAEIGMYVTNSPERKIWPAFMGLAYVVSPAVEGLNGFAKQTEEFSVQTEEPVVTGTTTQTAPPKPGETPKASAPEKAEFKIGGVATTDFARVQSYIADLEQSYKTAQEALATATTENHALAEFKKAAVQQARESRVNDLGRAIDGRPAVFTAPELEREREFAKTLSDEQFEAYMTRYSQAPANPILLNFGAQKVDELAPGAVQDAEKDQNYKNNVEVCKSLLQFSKMTPEQVEKTSAFQQLRNAGYTGSPTALA